MDAHYDPDADIAWFRSPDYDPGTVISIETPDGLREIDPATGGVVGFECWRAADRLPAGLLGVLGRP